MNYALERAVCEAVISELDPKVTFKIRADKEFKPLMGEDAEKAAKTTL